MKKIQNLIASIKEKEQEIPVFVRAACESLFDAIVEMVMVDQLYTNGINGDGVKLADYEPYSRFTIEIKQERGQPTDRVTLKDSGAFHHYGWVIYEDTGFRVTSIDDKTRKLVTRYGEAIFKLTTENQIRLSHRVRDKIASDVKNSLS